MGGRAWWRVFLWAVSLAVYVGPVDGKVEAADCADCLAEATESARQESTRQYVPVQMRRGNHQLPSLASEVAPRPGELGGASRGPREERYVPVQPLGVWDDKPTAGQEVPQVPTAEKSQGTSAMQPAPEPVEQTATGRMPSKTEPLEQIVTGQPPAALPSGTGSNTYVLQLAAFRNSAGIARFIEENNLGSLSLQHVSTPGRDGTWEVLIYGSYPNATAAQAAALDFIHDYGVEPWVRSQPRPVSGGHHPPDEHDRGPLPPH